VELYGGVPPAWITGVPDVIEFYNAPLAAAVTAGKSRTLGFALKPGDSPRMRLPSSRLERGLPI